MKKGLKKRTILLKVVANQKIEIDCSFVLFFFFSCIIYTNPSQTWFCWSFLPVEWDFFSLHRRSMLVQYEYSLRSQRHSKGRL